jgi:hypothetical protein
MTSAENKMTEKIKGIRMKLLGENFSTTREERQTSKLLRVSEIQLQNIVFQL